MPYWFSQVDCIAYTAPLIHPKRIFAQGSVILPLEKFHNPWCYNLLLKQPSLTTLSDSVSWYALGAWQIGLEFTDMVNWKGISSMCILFWESHWYSLADFGKNKPTKLCLPHLGKQKASLNENKSSIRKLKISRSHALQMKISGIILKLLGKGHVITGKTVARSDLQWSNLFADITDIRVIVLWSVPLCLWSL